SLASVVAVRLEDRRRRVDAIVRLELRPGQISASVERRVRVVVGDDPRLVVEQLSLAEVATLTVVDGYGYLPAKAPVPRNRYDEVAITSLGARRMLQVVVERRMDCDAVLDVEHSDRVAASFARVLPRHIPGLPGLAAVE